jgi:hypothetical protein
MRHADSRAGVCGPVVLRGSGSKTEVLQFPRLRRQRRNLPWLESDPFTALADARRAQDDRLGRRPRRLRMTGRAAWLWITATEAASR